VDPAVTAAPTADASGLVVLGRAGQVVYCLEAVAAKVRLPELLDLMEAADHRWHVRRIAFEAVAGFRGVADLLESDKRFQGRVESIPQTKAKRARVSVLDSYVKAGSFRLRARPAGGGVDPGQQDLWDEMLAFPHGSSDDLVDAAAMGTAWLMRNSREPNIYFPGWEPKP